MYMYCDCFLLISQQKPALKTWSLTNIASISVLCILLLSAIKGCPIPNIYQLSQGFCVNMIAYKHFRKSSIKTMLCLFNKRMYGQFLHGLIFAQSNIKPKVHRILRFYGGQVDVSLCLTCTWMLPTVYPRQIKIKSFIKKRLMSYLLNKFITTFLSNM